MNTRPATPLARSSRAGLLASLANSSRDYEGKFSSQTFRPRLYYQPFRRSSPSASYTDLSFDLTRLFESATFSSLEEVPIVRLPRQSLRSIPETFRFRPVITFLCQVRQIRNMNIHSVASVSRMYRIDFGYLVDRVASHFLLVNIC